MLRGQERPCISALITDFQARFEGLRVESGFLNNQTLFVKSETYSRFPRGSTDARLPRLQRDNANRT
jgi:hypothetical protein